MIVDLRFRVPNPPQTCPAPDLLQEVLSCWEGQATTTLEDNRPKVRRAVAAAALAARFGPDMPRCLAVRVSASTGDREVLGTLLRILAPEEADTPLRWRQLFARPIDMLQCVIDAADRGEIRIWLDFEQSISPQFGRWLELIHQFARRSAWLVSHPTLQPEATRHEHPITPAHHLGAALAFSQGTLPLDQAQHWLQTDSLPATLYAIEGRVGAHGPAEPHDTDWDARVMTALAAEGDTLAACRLAVRLGDWDQADAWVRTHLESWIRQGHGPELARRLAHTGQDTLTWAALRCAVESWGVEQLRNMDYPVPTTAQQRYTLALRAVVLGEPGEAAAWCENALELCTSEELMPLRERLVLLYARQLSHLGRHHDAAEYLEPLARAGHQMAGILWCVQRIQTEARMDELEPWLQLTPTVVEDDHLVGFDPALALVEAAVYADRMHDAQAILDRMLADRARPESAYEIYVGAFLAIQRGDFPKVKASMARLSQLASSSAAIDLGWRFLTCRDRLARGPFDGLREAIESMAEQATQLADMKHFGLARGMRIRLDMLTGKASEPIPWPEGTPVPRRIAAMHGGAKPDVVTPRGQLRQMRVLAFEGLASGQLDVAARSLQSAREVAQQNGLVLDEAEVVVLGAWLQTLRGETDNLWIDDLQQFAVHFASTRHATHHRFLKALAQHDLGALEAFTDMDRIAPMAARGARAALQRMREPDLLMTAVRQHAVQQLARRWENVIEAGPGWGLDTITGQIWRAGAPSVSIQRSVRLQSILRTLARHGGEASKEVLHQEAWGASSYHPLRDDKRIQVAMRDLRRRVEPAPSTPIFLLTTEDGYALSPRASFTLLHASDPP